MNCIPEVYKQLTHLSKTINQCNYIDYEDKRDLVADSILNIFEKYNEGILVDDFNEIKGYTFITIRNSCIAFRKRNRVSYFENLQEVPNIENKEDTDSKLVYWKERSEFVFVICMALLLIYYFRPGHMKPIERETSLMFFLFGWILIITAKWGDFFSSAKWYRNISSS